MRMTPTMGDLDAAQFLCHLHDLGITSHHSSHEYDSYATYTDAVRQVRLTGREFEHVVKLSSPGFDEDRFEPATLERHIDRELAALGATTIDNVQWLARTSDPSDDASRRQIIERQAAEIDATFERLIDSGKARSFSCFPYTPGAATAACALGSVTGLCTYLNLIEREYDEREVPTIAIRPLAGGRLSALGKVALAFPLLRPHVAITIVSLGSATRRWQQSSRWANYGQTALFQKFLPPKVVRLPL